VKEPYSAAGVSIGSAVVGKMLSSIPTSSFMIAEKDSGNNAQNKQGTGQDPRRFHQKIRGFLHATQLTRALKTRSQSSSFRILDQDDSSEKDAYQQNDRH